MQKSLGWCHRVTSQQLYPGAAFRSITSEPNCPRRAGPQPLVMSQGDLAGQPAPFSGRTSHTCRSSRKREDGEEWPVQTPRCIPEPWGLLLESQNWADEDWIPEF